MRIDNLSSLEVDSRSLRNGPVEPHCAAVFVLHRARVSFDEPHVFFGHPANDVSTLDRTADIGLQVVRTYILDCFL